jgi:3-oxoadipate enol-lactonase
MRVNVNGIETAYALTGKKEAPAVVLSHALSASMDMWEHQVTPLEQRYQVLRYDTRGHGATQAVDGPYTLDQLGDDAISLFDTLGVKAAHWVGISMGGMIGQNIALRYPHRLASLCLCDTTAVMGPDSQPLWDERIAIAKKQGMSGLVDATLDRWFTKYFHEMQPPQVEQIRRQILATPIAGYVGCSEAIRRLDYLKDLHRIKLPTLVMVGEEDPATTVEDARDMRERIPHSQLVVIPAAAHLSNVQQPEVFNASLVDFLKKTDGC